MTGIPDFSSLSSSLPTLPPLPGIEGLSSYAKPLVPSFPDPSPLDLSDEDKEEIVNTIENLLRASSESRSAWSKHHQDYDLMFRGALDIRGPDAGPWPDSSNLHVQMPYWLVDSYNTRLVASIWSQNPLVTSHPVEDDDVEISRNAANLVRWHLSPKKMNARAAWSRISKTRCIHGRGVGILPWAKDEYVYRVAGDKKFKRDNDGNLVSDEFGLPIETSNSSGSVYKREVRYDGPLLVPLEWDDVIEPMEGTNLQPVSPSNPLGADWVGIRQWEQLSLIWKKRDTAYKYIDKDSDLSDKDSWLSSSPSQDRSGSGPLANNQERVRLQDYVEGRTRRTGERYRSPNARFNPESEIMTWFMQIGRASCRERV